MKDFIILFLIICTSNLHAQLKFNHLELFFAGGLSQNYGVPIAPRQITPGYYYVVSSEIPAISHQFGVLLFPKKTQIGRFSLGIGIQGLRLRSIVKADTLSYFNNYNNSLVTQYNVRWNVKQFLGQLPFLIRYTAIEKGAYRFFAEGGIVLSVFNEGHYPQGYSRESPNNYHPGYLLGLGYTRLIKPGDAHLFLSTSLTWFRTQGKATSAQIPGFIGIRIAAGLEWNVNGK